MRTTIAILMLLLLGIRLESAAQPADADPLFEEQATVRLRELWIRMRPVPLAAPGACDDFGLEQLEVEVDGQPIDRALLQGLSRRPRPTLHALLIDTSSSTRGKIDRFREAVAEYIDGLDPRLDRAFLMTFDESVLLQHPVTRDLQALREEAGRIRMAGSTALNDGLLFAMNELETHRERPVLLLLTDGFDTASSYSRDDVHAMVAQRPDLSIFVVGVGLPPIRGGGPAGALSTRRFLQKIAADSNGHFFEIGTGGRVSEIFERIRSMLGREALLSFTDEVAQEGPREVRVRSRNRDCRVLTFVHRPQPADERHRPIAESEPDGDMRRALLPGDSRRAHYSSRSKNGMDPECAADEALWYLASTDGGARGCVLDITMEQGLLYSADSSSHLFANGWIKQKTRPVSIELPSPEALPATPEQWLEAFAAEAQAAAERHVEHDPRQIPIELHARPYHDLPMLVHGKLFFELRAALARIAFADPEYARWVATRLEQRAEQELAQQASRLREMAPGLDEVSSLSLARESLDGQAILARATSPSEVDLQEFLAAWLGDVSAHELFLAWERREVNHMLDSDGVGSPDFTARWQAARKLFFVPSYARVLTVLAPIHDRQTQRIGYIRIVLPRASWMLSRVQNWEGRLDYSDLPPDLVPEWPLAGWLLSQAEVRRELRAVGGEISALRYELTGKPASWVPRRAFEQSRVIFELDAGDGRREELSYEVVVEDGSPRLR